MLNGLRVVSALFLCAIAGCGDSDSPDTVFINGAVYTLDPEREWAEAVAVTDGHISKVGTSAEVSALVSRGTEVIDLDGKMLLPGFHDTHIHPIAAITDAMCDVAGQGAANVLKALAACRDEGIGVQGEWLVGYGWKDKDFSGETLPDRFTLDALDFDGPIVLQDQYGHSSWANSEALRRARVTVDTADPIGGRILRDGEGQPTGILRDTAQDLVQDQAAREAPILQSIWQATTALDGGVALLNAHGITSYVDAMVFPEMVDLYQLLVLAGRLTARVQLSLWAYPNDDDEAQISRLLGQYSNEPGAMLKINQVKMYIDGILQSQTARLSSPYLGAPHEYGLNYFTEDRVTRYIRELSPEGFQFHLHAIGDAAVHEALNAVERATEETGDLDRRHHMVHLEAVQERDLPRFATLGVLPNPQMSYGMPDSPARSVHLQAISNFMGLRITPLQSHLDNGAKLVLSSDWSAGTLSPLIGIQAAVTRQHIDADSAEDYVSEPEERISLADAIRAYTLNAAYLMHQEELTGSIEEGKLADLVVLSENLFEISPYAIHEVRVLATLLEGDIVYQQQGSE
ncbi:MAG: amidohydrolase [Pseudomonadota bacterium]